MTYDEALAALVGFVGREVTIMITAGARGTPGATIAFIHGRMERAENRGPAVMPPLGAGPDEWNDHDAQFFVVGSRETGFYVSPQAFHGAEWTAEHSLRIEHGPDVVLSVVTQPGPTGSGPGPAT
jgi:hypothetical protein